MQGTQSTILGGCAHIELFVCYFIRTIAYLVFELDIGTWMFS